MAAKGSVVKSNDPNQRIRKYKGKIVQPVLYNGRGCGHGCYFTGQTDNALIVDSTGRPVPLRDIGDLVLITAG